jgi:hypothetical protein
MSLTYTIDGTTFAGISSTGEGRYAIEMDAGSNVMDIRRFRVPGVNGQYIIRAGSSGRRIVARMRYIGSTAAAAEALYHTDVDLWTTKQVAIGLLGITYKGCNLMGESVHRLSPIKATGRQANYCYFDVAMTFQQDNPAGES